MDDMEQKLNSILGNPEMMAQIMNMAQAMNANSAPPKQEPQPPPPQPQAAPSLGMDIGMIQKIASFAQQSGVDRDQQALLKALRPYLSKERIAKLEKAMRAAKLAGVASTALGGTGSIFFPGR